MRTKVIILGSALAVVFALGLGVAAWAQDHGAWGHRFRGQDPEARAGRLLALLDNDHVKSQLGLTDQQANQLRQIVVGAEKSSIKTRADMAVREIELRELLRSDNPDRETVLKKVQEISNLRGEMMKQHIEALLAAKSVLTPEQQKKIRSFIESHHFGPSEHREMREHHGMPGHPPAPPENAPKPPSE
jgi:Spy/CpxP family protein refolding chaperone